MRPENVDLMMLTTNMTIFKLNCGDVTHARSTDIKFHQAEQDVVKSTYPIIRAVEELKKIRQPALKPAIDKLVDGIILLTDTVQDLEQSRRDLYKTVLPEGWKGLLAKSEESHNELFGNIEALLKDCQADTKVQEQAVEERAKEAKKNAEKLVVSKRKLCDFSGYQNASRQQYQQPKFSKNENHFPKQIQGALSGNSPNEDGRGYRR